MRKLIQQLIQRFALALFELRKAIKTIKGPRLTLFENDLCTRNPVGAFAHDQMADDIEGAPTVFAFVLTCPNVGKATQQTAKSCRGSREKGDGIGQAECCCGWHGFKMPSAVIWTQYCVHGLVVCQNHMPGHAVSICLEFAPQAAFASYISESKLAMVEISQLRTAASVFCVSPLP